MTRSFRRDGPRNHARHRGRNDLGFGFGVFADKFRPNVGNRVSDDRPVVDAGLHAGKATARRNEFGEDHDLERTSRQHVEITRKIGGENSNCRANRHALRNLVRNASQSNDDQDVPAFIWFGRCARLDDLLHVWTPVRGANGEARNRRLKSHDATAIERVVVVTQCRPGFPELLVHEARQIGTDRTMGVIGGGVLQKLPDHSEAPGFDARSRQISNREEVEHVECVQAQAFYRRDFIGTGAVAV